MSARPFIKSAGGKTQLLTELLKRVPADFGTYHEPFLGGGALFFALRPKRAVLTDANGRLIGAYTAVRDNCSKVIQFLRRQAEMHRDDPRATYYETREIFNTREMRVGSPADAARFIYLNKTCFNGLWRTNRCGEFNVPMGAYKNPTICDEENLRACSEVLQGAHLAWGDFAREDHLPIPGDFWYADPPYVPVSKTANFTSYTRDGFTLEDQKRLQKAALLLRREGVRVLLSNALVPEVTALYGTDFTIEEVAARRAINSKGGKRGAVSEALIS